MKKHILTSWLLLCFVILLLFGCNVDKGNKRTEKYGGTLRVNASNVPDAIFPGQVLNNSEHLLIYQVYAGLVKYHPKTLEIVPSIAKNWRIEQNKTLYTFNLSAEAFFHNDLCFSPLKTRKIVSADVKYSIEQTCKSHLKSNHTLSRQIYNIVGSDSLINAVENYDSLTISGIRVINDTTLQFKLKQPDAMFIHFLAGTNCLVYPKEGFNSYGLKSTVGSGPFTYNYPKIKGEPIVLKAFEKYFHKNKQGEQLPYLDTIVVSFITSTSRELYLFKSGQLDIIVGLPKKYLTPFLDENIDKFQSNPPYFIMRETQTPTGDFKYNLLRSNVQQFEINAQNYFDFSRVYFSNPDENTIQILN